MDYAGPYIKWLQQRFTDLQRSGIKPLKPTAAASLDVRFFSELCCVLGPHFVLWHFSKQSRTCPSASIAN